MSKQEFLSQLYKGLSGLPKDDIEERVTFYKEMIEDRIEDGLSEEEAVNGIGNIDEIISQIVSDIPLTNLIKEKVIPKKRLKAWEIILLVLGSPIWLSVLIAVIAVFFSLYVVLWSVIVSLWSVFVSMIACALGFVASGIGFTCGGYVLSGVAMMGVGVMCAGLSIFVFYGCKALTKGIVIFTKKLTVWTKNCFIKKEEAR